MPIPTEPAAISNLATRRCFASLAVLLAALVCAPVAHAQADDPLDAVTLSARWAALGRPGWTPDASLSVGQAWAIAGLARGAWRLDSPFSGGETYGPGVREAEVPRAWFDSVAVVFGGGGAVGGWDGSLVRAEGLLTRPAPGRARTMFTVVNGSSSIDRNAALFSRGDARGWIRAGATGDTRETVGAMGPAAAHAWIADAAWLRGRHVIEAVFRQRGAAIRQDLGVGEGMRGQNGRVRWSWSDTTHWATAALHRGWDARDSRAEVEGVQFDESRRDAQRTGFEASAGRLALGGRVSARFSADRERVRRPVDLAGGNVFDVRAERWWGSLRLERPLAGGALDASIGSGWHSAFRAIDDAVQIAPSIAWRFTGVRGEVRVFGERVLTPLWADLTPGTSAFLQSTWMAGAEGAWRVPGVGAVRVLAGSGTTDGAVVMLRYPIEDVALRGGLSTAVGDSRPFSLVSITAGGRWRALIGELESYATTAGGGSLFGPRYDPRRGAAARLETEFRAFSGDLGVRLVGEAAWVGRREAYISDAFGSFTARSLAGYPSYNALVSLAVGDAVIRIRGLNLADERRPDVWVDLATGEPALGSGRQILFELGWVFFN